MDPTQWFIEPNAHFVYTQVLFDCLLHLESTGNDRNEVLFRCEREYTENPEELKLINEFRHHYTPSQALCWFTRDAFISNLLKRALCIQNVDLLILLRFFLCDIQEQLDKHRCVVPMRVYRSQSMSLAQFELLKQSVGDFVSMNVFLSTVVNRDMSLLLLDESSDADGSQRVLFEIDADPTVKGAKSFSSVPRLNSTSEEEILFSLGCTFRLNNLVQGEDDLWLIQMTLCSTEETQVDAVFEYLESESEERISSPLLFGIVLQDLNRYDQAEGYYQHLFKSFSGNTEKQAQCEAVWTTLKRKKSNYLTNLEAIETSGSANKDLHQASNYTFRGDYYRRKDDFPRALESYQLALTVWKKFLTENHPEVARCLTHIASLYHHENEYEQALSHYQKALEIFEQHLSPDHPELKTIHHHLTCLYRSLELYEKALEHYKKWESDSTAPWLFSDRRLMHDVHNRGYVLFSVVKSCFSLRIIFRIWD